MYVSFIGNLTSDAKEFERTNRDGEKDIYLSFSVAETTISHGQKGTEFIDCLSEKLNAFAFLKKGKRVAVHGYAVIERKPLQDGTNVARVKVRVHDIKLL